MAASDHLGKQFIGLKELMNLPTRDYGSLPVSAITPKMLPKSRKQYLDLKEDIETHGMKTPIEVHEETSEEGPWLYEGHHRAVIAGELKMDKIPVKYVNTGGKPY
ncbi:hypothetical protein EBU95_21930 [bacterium]|nr:hypothetical protein [bacterium]